MEFEAFGRKLRLKWHFHNEIKNIYRDIFKLSSKFNSRDSNAAMEVYLSNLEEKLVKFEVPKDKFNNLSNNERKTLNDLKSDKKVVIKSANKGSAVVALDSEDYIIEAKEQLGDEEAYKEVSDNTAPFLKTINAVIAKIIELGDLKIDNLDYLI